MNNNDGLTMGQFSRGVMCCMDQNAGVYIPYICIPLNKSYIDDWDKYDSFAFMGPSVKDLMKEGFIEVFKPCYSRKESMLIMQAVGTIDLQMDDISKMINENMTEFYDEFRRIVLNYIEETSFV